MARTARTKKEARRDVESATSGATTTEQRQELQQLTLRVPRDVHVALKVVAQATGRSANELGVAAIRNYLSEEGHREAVDLYIEETRLQYRVALDKLADL